MGAPVTLEALETPAALVDVGRVEANLRRTADYCRAHGLAWRPHAKTHKVAELGRMQVEAGAAGLTVATAREAEVMSAVCGDLLHAYPAVGEARLRRLLALPADARLTVALDSAEALEGLARAASAAGRTVGVLVEIDAGMRRVGVGAPEEAVRLARRAAELDGVEHRGVAFYPGHVRAPLAEQTESLRAVSARLDPFLRALERAGLPAETVSGGSTPTLWRSHEVAGTTEVRAGISVFHDRTGVAMGVCGWDEVAYSVLATVVSTAVPGQAVVDAGSKALGREPVEPLAEGFGALLGRPEVTVRALSEEHGVLDLSATRWRPRVGERVWVVPNHVCLSVAAFDRVVALRGGEAAEWRVAARGW